MNEFYFTIDSSFSKLEIENLWQKTAKANQTIHQLLKGKLTFDDAIALCESFDVDSKETIDCIYDNLEFFNFKL